MFDDLRLLKNADRLILIEEELFFNQYAFHKQKLAYHRASMQAYYQRLIGEGFDVEYVDAFDQRSAVRTLINSLAENEIKLIHVYRVNDAWLERRMKTAATENKMGIEWYESPLFMLTQDEIEKEFSGKKRFFQTSFYIQQRKKFAVLLDEAKNPVGGKWSFDAENRKAYPKNKTAPALHQPLSDAIRAAARVYVEKKYPDNPGMVEGPIVYPINHAEAKAWLDDFLQNRFAEFGLYEDAMVVGEYLLHHSLLTPMLNTGLLTPKQVIDQVVDYSVKHAIPLNSVEGFVRQIMGWREFIRGIYHAVGSKQRTTNYWNFTRKIPSSFYTGTTGIVPVDEAIRKLLSTGYNHHIERLMILSNFMLLCEFDPDEVYRWFMEMYIDAYDWVMVPNVYGMGQFADGGLMCTKPYISGSNYVLKMSDHKKDSSWTDIWDALFWRFMHVHRDFFLSNPRIGMLVRTFDKMSVEKREGYLRTAENYLEKLQWQHEK